MFYTCVSLTRSKRGKLTFKLDESQPADSVHSRWTETYYDGNPDGPVPEVPSHWHRYHDEHMQVVYGRVEFTCDGKTTVRGPEDGELVIPRLHVHGLRFLKGEAAMFTEKTNPTGTFKREFFEDLLETGDMNVLKVWRAFYYGDTFIALPGGFKIMDQVVTLSLGWLSAVVFGRKNPGLTAEVVASQRKE